MNKGYVNSTGCPVRAVPCRLSSWTATPSQPSDGSNPLNVYAAQDPRVFWQNNFDPDAMSNGFTYGIDASCDLHGNNVPQYRASKLGRGRLLHYLGCTPSS